MAWRRHDEASTSAIGLSVSTVVFAIAFVSANLMVEKPGGIDRRTGVLDVVATTGLDLIVQQAGRTSASAAWVSLPDQLMRFGLAEDGKPNFLDYRKIKSMRNATMAHVANNAPDYPDVRTALGLEAVDFHLRTYPVIPSLEDPRWSKDTRGRLAYVGHYVSGAGAGSMVEWANTSGDTLNVSLAIRNDGAEPHIFVANIGVGDLASDVIIANDDRHTRLLAPGEVQTVWANFPAMAYAPALTGVKLELSDALGHALVDAHWIAASAPAGTNAPWAPLLTAGAVYYESGETVKFVADHFEGDGTRVHNQDQPAIFVLVGPNGDEWVNESVQLPKNKAYTHACSNCTMAGTYRATVWDGLVTRRATDIVVVSPTELFDGIETLAPVATREVDILGELVATFNGQQYTDANTQGDVFSDSSHIRDLDNELSRYTTLVVGSEVKQSALNAGETKWAIASWVQAGGVLIVLGTMESQSHWLEPVYFAAQETANGGISAPDPTHPVLTAPDRMNYQSYLDNGRAWRIKSDQPFTHVLTRGQSQETSDDTLAISAPGAYNDGTVVLTSYMAGALTSPQDDHEAKRFLHNLLSQSYTMLFLDYGPPIPPGTPVGSAQRLVAVPHPSVPNAVVEVRIVMYAWNGG